MGVMSEQTRDTSPPQTPSDAPTPDEPGEVRPGTRVVVVGGGPGGYEAALVAAQLGADVTVVERDGLGGAAVLTDCRPVQDPDRHRRGDDARRRRRRARRALPRWRRPRSRHGPRRSTSAGSTTGSQPGAGAVRRRAPPARERRACASSAAPAGCCRPSACHVEPARTAPRRRSTPTSCCSPPARAPRALPDADARRRAHPHLDASCTTSTSCPSGSSSSAPASPGPSSPSPTTRSASTSSSSPAATGCCPGEDADAAEVLEEVFRRRGMTVLSRSRAESVEAHRATGSSSRSPTAAPSRARTA